jgi:hypothetical protein
MTRNKDFYLILLANALIEMRAAPTEGNPELAPKLADMFHNVPGALRLPWTADRDERIYEQIRAKAVVYGLSELLDRWERNVHNRLASEAEEAAGHEEAIASAPPAL